MYDDLKRIVEEELVKHEFREHDQVIKQVKREIGKLDDDEVRQLFEDELLGEGIRQVISQVTQKHYRAVQADARAKAGEEEPKRKPRKTAKTLASAKRISGRKYAAVMVGRGDERKSVLQANREEITAESVYAGNQSVSWAGRSMFFKSIADSLPDDETHAGDVLDDDQLDDLMVQAGTSFVKDPEEV